MFTANKNIIGVIIFFAIVFIFSFSSVFPQKNFSDKEARLDSLLKIAWKNRSCLPEKALEDDKRAIALAENLRDYSKTAQAYNYLGVIYRNIGKYDDSFKSYKKAFYYANLAGDSSQIAYCYNNFGGFFSFKGEYNLALDNIFKAQRIFEKLNNPRGVAYTKLQAGLAYYKLKNYPMAKEQYSEVISIRKSLKDTLGVAVTKLLLSDTYVMLKNFDEAEKLLREALVVFKKFNDTKGIGATYGDLAEVQYYRGEIGQAIENRYKAIPLLEKINYKIGVVENKLGLARCYYELGQIDSALYYLDESSSLALNIKYISGYLKTLRAYFDIYLSQNNVEAASYYAQKILDLNDSLYANEIILQSNEFKKLTRARNIETANLSLAHNVRKQNILVYYLIGFLILFVFFISIIYWQNLKIKKRSVALETAVNDKNKLFSIVAHDLKNPFHSLLGYSDFLLNELDADYPKEDIKSGIEQMRSSAHKLLDMVENLLQWARSQTGKIKYLPQNYSVKEIIDETIQYYQQSVNVKKIELSVDIEENLKCFCDKDMIQTVLRNLLSNSIKFTKEGGKIFIRAKSGNEKDEVVFEIEDTGTGIDGKLLPNLFEQTFSKTGTSGEKGTGLGLKIIKDMIEKNGGKISVTSQVGIGTIFIFTLPKS